MYFEQDLRVMFKLLLLVALVRIDGYPDPLDDMVVVHCDQVSLVGHKN